MMHRVTFVFVRTPFEKRKVYDPKKIPHFASRHKLLHLCDTQTQSPQHFTSNAPFISSEKNAIALLNIQLGLQRGLLSVTEEFHNRRFPFAVLNLDEGETFGAVQLCNFCKLIGLADGESGKAFCVDCFHDATGIKRTAKNLE